MAPRPQRSAGTKEREHLATLTAFVAGTIAKLDAEMRLPSDHARGQRIAKIMNDLEMANDRARYFGLGIDWRTDNKRNRS